MKTMGERIQRVAGLAALLLLMAGCASSGYKQGTKTSKNIQKAADRIAAMPEEIDLTMISLNDLVNNPQADLRPQYKKFVSGMKKVTKAAEHVAAARAEMAKKGKEFFSKWDAQLAEIKNEDIKSRSQARKDEVQQKLQAIKESYARAEEAFQPFIADLKDIQRYLDADLTRDGLAAIQTTVSKASTELKPVSDSLKRLADDFRALGVSMSASVPQSQ